MKNLVFVLFAMMMFGMVSCNSGSATAEETAADTLGVAVDSLATDSTIIVVEVDSAAVDSVVETVEV